MPGLPRLLFDANPLLRFLRNDVPEQAAAVRTKMIQAQSGQLIIDIHPLVLSEVVYVLKSNYAQPREQIADALLPLLDIAGFHVLEADRVRKALIRYRNTNVSFIDAFLATLSAETSHPVFSFDRGLDKFKDIRRVNK